MITVKGTQVFKEQPYNKAKGDMVFFPNEVIE